MMYANLKLPRLAVQLKSVKKPPTQQLQLKLCSTYMPSQKKGYYIQIKSLFCTLLRTRDTAMAPTLAIFFCVATVLAVFSGSHSLVPPERDYHKWCQLCKYLKTSKTSFLFVWFERYLELRQSKDFNRNFFKFSVVNLITITIN